MPYTKRLVELNVKVKRLIICLLKVRCSINLSKRLGEIRNRRKKFEAIARKRNIRS